MKLCVFKKYAKLKQNRLDNMGALLYISFGLLKIRMQGVTMAITIEEVKRIAELAKLAFDDQSLEEMARDLERIVGYVEKLKELDVSEVPETSHVVEMKNVMREDEVERWLSNEEALGNAPASKQGYFSVPKVIG